MAFIPRLSVNGIYQSQYWYSGTNPFYTPSLELPNCTCYAWGRTWEIAQQPPTYLPTGNAGTWYDNLPSGYRKGSSPELGAIACWYDPDGYYAGHVAVVEQINASGLVTSNSGYYRPIASYPPDTHSYFWTENCPASTGYRSTWMVSRGYVLKGFIYLTTPVSLDWIKGNRYLTQAESDNNAYIVYSYLLGLGWSFNAICATLGNMYRESQVNPGLWENHPAQSGGFGLVQWTPATNFTNWADRYGYAHDSGDAQLQWINDETVPSGQWIPTVAYPVSFDDYKVSTQSVDWLTGVFQRNFERNADYNDLVLRQQYAQYYYDLLQHYNPDDPPYDPGRTGKKMKIWQMIRYHF